MASGVETKSENDKDCHTEMGLELQLYPDQVKNHWPKEGNHILAQYDTTSLVVYQAFKPSIAKYAVENQSFGGPDFSFSRMSWIKTNFLWMMYRSGWASKKNQECILAVHLKRSGFDSILANAYTAQFQRSQGLSTYEIGVRLQWDPDHTPNYHKENRRAIQLGLKGDILKKYGTEWIVKITDITDFVKQQRKLVDEDRVHELMTPKERVYPVHDHSVMTQIELDQWQS